MTISTQRIKQRLTTLRLVHASGMNMEKVYDEFTTLINLDAHKTLKYDGIASFAKAELGISQRTAYNYLRAGRIRNVMRSHGLKYPSHTRLSIHEWVAIEPDMVDRAKAAMFKDENLRFEAAIRNELHGETLTLDFSSLEVTNPAVLTTLMGVAALITEPAETLKENEEALLLALLALTKIVDDCE